MLAPDKKVVSGILVIWPLQMENVEAVETVGAGLIVTVMVSLGPIQPKPDVGVITYFTLAAAVFELLCKESVIEAPAPMVVPVMPPTIGPSVRANELPAPVLESKLMLVLASLQIVAVAGVTTTGNGLTVTVTTA